MATSERTFAPTSTTDEVLSGIDLLMGGEDSKALEFKTLEAANDVQFA